jgi:hypothetical protein
LGAIGDLTKWLDERGLPASTGMALLRTLFIGRLGVAGFIVFLGILSLPVGFAVGSFQLVRNRVVGPAFEALARSQRLRDVLGLVGVGLFSVGAVFDLVYFACTG